MSFGLSIGDIILCSQITYRLFDAATSGRKNAPRGLRELEGTLFGLKCSLDYLQRASTTLLSRSYHDARNIQEQLGYMIHSCHETLEALDKATAKYRDAAKEAVPTAKNRKNLDLLLQQEFTSRVKVQWRRFVWDLKGESFSQYQGKLQSHTNAITLLLSTLIWSATDRIEENDRRQEERMEQLMRQASYFNGENFRLKQNHYPLLPPRSSTLPRRATSSTLSGFEAVRSVPLLPVAATRSTYLDDAF